ncbi:MAG TPA: glycosyltransferase [Parafilimonas sp.]|nr:glycosyltransferase [Parafilimonas sp.]
MPAHIGGQKNIALFCKYLGAVNNLTAISVNDNDINLAETYKMIPLFSKKRIRYVDPFYVLSIKKIVKQTSIKNVITEHPYMAWMGWYLKRTANIKWFVRSHNIEFERFRTLNKPWYKLLKIYEKWAYKNADTVFFITNEDIDFAVKNSMVKKENAVLVPFGVELKEMPSDKPEQKKKICDQHNIPEGTTLLLFNGALDYPPNADALSFILDKINPLLLKNTSFNYRIIICGRGLPSSFNNLKNFTDKNIIYAGFVNDVYAYFKAADIFLNPVVRGGGVKTKIIEAMGYGATVISCVSGSAGIEFSVCGEKIKIVPDNDAEAFTYEISKLKDRDISTPREYYAYYSWQNIIKKLQLLFVN